MAATGLRPSFAQKFEMAGIQLPDSVFLVRRGG
jgi:hypothetical protein